MMIQRPKRMRRLNEPNATVNLKRKQNYPLVILTRMVSTESGGKRIQVAVNRRVTGERSRDSVCSNYFKDILLRRGAEK